MEGMLQGIPQVVCFMDDILVMGESDAVHMRNLEEVLKRLQGHGVRLRKDKCRFLMDSVEYLWQWVDSRGVHTSPQKVRAVLQAPAPPGATIVPKAHKLLCKVFAQPLHSPTPASLTPPCG